MNTTASRVRCGNHDTLTYHASVAEVRDCHTGSRPAATVAPRADFSGGAKMMTDAQQSFIIALAAQHTLDGCSDWVRAKVARLTSALPAPLDRSQASQIINILKQQPKRPAAQRLPLEDMPDVPAGRYAIERDGTLKFYKVDRPTEGTWAGRTFVKVMASDEQHPVRDMRSRIDILKAIALDPRAASLRYGREIGSCGICGRTLTDEESRRNGIGPICAGKVGW